MADGNLAADPSYLAYLRALGFAEGEAQSSAADKLAGSANRVAFFRPEVEFQAGEERRSISQDHEARGMLRSGAHERALAVSRRGEQTRVGALELGAADEATSIQAELAREIVRLQTGAAETALQVAQKSYLRDGDPQAPLVAEPVVKRRSEAPLGGF